MTDIEPKDKPLSKESAEPTPEPDAPEDTSTKRPEDSKHLIKLAIDRLKEHIVLTSELDYWYIVLWMIHARLRGKLPNRMCLYLGFAGAKHSGKTVATTLVSNGVGGEFVAGTSEASFRAYLDNEVILGIDEVDTQPDDVISMLRTGSVWNATYTKQIQNDKGEWVTKKINVGGAKVFNWASQLDSALASRTMIIQLQAMNDYKIVTYNQLNLDGGIHRLKGITESLAKLFKLTEDEINDYVLKSEECRRIVSLIKSTSARTTERATLFALELHGLGFTESEIVEVVSSLREHEEETSDTTELVRETLVELYDNAERVNTVDGCRWIEKNELKKHVNERLSELGWKKGIGDRRFSESLRELGFVLGKNWKKLPFRYGKRPMILVYDAIVLRQIGLDDDQLPTQSTLATSDDITKPLKLAMPSVNGSCLYCHATSDKKLIHRYSDANGREIDLCDACFESEGFKRASSDLTGGDSGV